MKKINKTIKILSLVFLMMLTVFQPSFAKVSAIDTSRADLGILDTLKITNAQGGEINNDSWISVDQWLHLRYTWSLDNPPSDYINGTAEFDLPNILDFNTVENQSFPLIYTDAEDNNKQHTIGNVTVNPATGKVTIVFNDNAVFSTKNNIRGWIDISVHAGKEAKEETIVVDWTGNDEVKIKVEIIESFPFTGDAVIAKYAIPHPITQTLDIKKDINNGRFYIEFNIEVWIYRDINSLTIKDTIFANLELVPDSIRVTSRPMDYANSLTNANYKDNFNKWNDSHFGEQSTQYDMTSDLKSIDMIRENSNGFEVQFDNVDFDATLASRQTSSAVLEPYQARYFVSYATYLSSIDSSLSLDDARTEFAKQDAKNHLSIYNEDSFIAETNWINVKTGGGAVGETRTLTVKKVDSMDMTPLSGAIVNLLKYNTNSYKWELAVHAIDIEVGGTILKDLVFGHYRFEETKAPEGYDLPDTLFDAFIIDADTVNNFEVFLKNDKTADYVGSVELTKYDDKTNPLNGAEFSLYQVGNATPLKTELVSGPDGKITVNELKEGNYYFVETKAPDGYVLDTTPVPFTISKDDVIALVTVSKVNTKIPDYAGSVELTKYDDKTNPLSGAEFSLYQVGNATPLKIELVSGPDGKITVNELKEGNYYFIETKAPDGYVLDTTPVPFTISKDDVISLVTVSKVNTKIPDYVGSVKLVKTDKNGKKLSGAEFSLYVVGNQKPLYTGLITNGAGELVINDLEVGSYYFVETKAPDGYELNSKELHFEIVDGYMEHVSLSFINTRTPELPSTGIQSNGISHGLLTLVIGCSCMMFSRRKEEKE